MHSCVAKFPNKCAKHKAETSCIPDREPGELTLTYAYVGLEKSMGREYVNEIREERRRKRVEW